jgi:hypothetical protein
VLAVIGDGTFIPWLVLVALILHVTPTGRTLGQSWRLTGSSDRRSRRRFVPLRLVVASPLGPAAFAPFALFPVWVIVVAAVVARRMHAIDSQNPAKD